ncbi:MAG: hypothetical protein ACFFCS_17655 [Candidatus Hodarchaeota archaeon]
MSDVTLYLAFGLFASGFILISTIVMFKQYLYQKTRSSLYMTLLWLFFFLYASTQTLGMVIKISSLVLFSLVFLIISGYFVILMVESISRASVDSRKIFFLTAISGFFLYTIYRPGRPLTVYVDGELQYNTDPDFIIAQFLFILYIGIALLHCFYKVYKNSPKKMKSIAAINLLGMFFITIISDVSVTLRLSEYIPQFHMICIGIGSFLTSYAFWRKPQLAYILPFKALRLSVIDTNTGLPLFSFDWVKDPKLVDQNLLSSMLQGLSMVLDEAVNRGKISEIKLDNGLIILEQDKQYPIVFALITTKTSQILRDSLKNFSECFIEKYSNEFQNSTQTHLFERATVHIPECFPLIPEY